MADLDLYNYSFYVIIDAPIKQRSHLIDTRKDTLDLHKKNIKAILPRTLFNLHTHNLNIAHNPLSFLPSIYSLRILNCNNCGLRELPITMHNLIDLSCANNFLTKLPAYKSLVKLDFSNNFVNCLDLSNYPKLKYVNCSGNMLTNIPASTISIKAENCPLLTVYYSSCKRSGVIKNGKFVWVMDKLYDDKYVLINWQLSTTKLTPTSRFAKKLFKFLFYI